MEKREFQGPIRPQDVGVAKRDGIPQAVFEIINGLIARNFRGNQAIVYVDEVIAEIVNRMNVSSEFVYKNKWIDVESAYQSAGWVVIYAKPGFNERFLAHFIFRPAP